MSDKVPTLERCDLIFNEDDAIERLVTACNGSLHRETACCALTALADFGWSTRISVDDTGVRIHVVRPSQPMAPDEEPAS